jgi:AcrR family transcriptional regulator
MSRSPPLLKFKRSREEKLDDTRRAIYSAAIEVVGEEGYANATIVKIAERAKVATGTFYNYFETRQELFDQLLPVLGERLLAHLRAQLPEEARGSSRELGRIRAYFDFCRRTPGFLRILNEAEVFAPAAYMSHVRRFYESYQRALTRSSRDGELKDFSTEDLDIVVFILFGVRSYLSTMYQYNFIDRSTASLERVLAVYEKLLTQGLFRELPPELANPAAGPGVA